MALPFLKPATLWGGPGFETGGKPVVFLALLCHWGYLPLERHVGGKPVIANDWKMM